MTPGELATTDDIAALRAELHELRDLLGEIRQALPPRMVSVAEAAKALGISTQTVTAMLRRGDLVGRKAGRRVLVDAATLRSRG